MEPSATSGELPRIVRYGTAVAVACTVAALTRWLGPFFDPPLLPFVPTSVVLFLVLGRGPALAALGAFCVLAAWASPPGRPVNLVSLALWVGSAALMALVADRSRRTGERARDEAKARSAEMEAQQREAQTEAERRKLLPGGDPAAKLEAVLHAVKDGIAVLDSDGHLFLVNESQARLSGFDSLEHMQRELAFFEQNFELRELDGRVVPPSEWPVAKVFRGERVEGWELRGRRLDTGQSWVFSFTGEPVRGPDGLVRRAVVVTRDITRLKEVQEALQESERRYSTVFSASPVALALSRAEDARIEMANEKYLELFELTREQAVGASALDLGFIDPEARASLVAQVRARGQAQHELTRVSKTGDRRTYSVSIVPIELGGQRLLLTGLLDLTERKLAEERLGTERQLLSESEARYRAMFEQAAIGVLIAQSSTGTILEANERVAQLFGVPRAALAGRRWQEFTHPDDVQPNEAGVRGLAPNGRYQTEKRYLRPDGGVVWARINVSPVALPGQPVDRQLAIIEDITEERRLASQFHQAQKLESIGRLAGGVAHDFNNLLTVVLSSVELLTDDLKAGQRVQLEDVEQIGFAAERARDLTRQLLAFARKQVISPVTLDPNELMRGAQRMLARLVGEDVRLEVSLAEGLWPVFADPGQVEQVIMNLAVNARDAMPRGGQLKLETANVTTPVGGEAPQGEWVRLRVADTGVGMSPDVRAHLFEPFFTTKEQGKGTGLGLATVYGIVTRAGGHVRVASEPGQGTTVDVYVPRATKQAEATAAPASARVVGGSERLLVVEDEAAVRGVLVRTLREAGYDVMTVPLPRLALELPDEVVRELHLLVTDVVMPELDGQVLSEALRARAPALKVLFVSGYTQDAIAERGVVDAGLSFLAKPFTGRALLEKVREVLDRTPQDHKGMTGL